MVQIILGVDLPVGTTFKMFISHMVQIIHEEAILKTLAVFSFISHMVQIILPTCFKNFINISLAFISHMVQIIREKRKLAMQDNDQFISHMVQIILTTPRYILSKILKFISHMVQIILGDSK